MTGYKLTRAAADDVAAIFRDGVERFGLELADRYHDGLAATFSFLAAYPQAARERIELRPPVRIHRYKAHLVIYEVRDQVVVLRVRHGREDWLAEMQER